MGGRELRNDGVGSEETIYKLCALSRKVRCSNSVPFVHTGSSTSIVITLIQPQNKLYPPIL
jgi:hypothetical protein